MCGSGRFLKLSCLFYLLGGGFGFDFFPNKCCTFCIICFLIKAHVSFDSCPHLL